MSKAQIVQKFVPQRFVSLKYLGCLDQPVCQCIGFHMAKKNKSLVTAAIMASSDEAKELVSGEGLSYY